MEITHIFEAYKEQQDWGKPPILKEFRAQFKGFTNSDIETLISYLGDNEKKWFVASLLDVLDSFPEDLLVPMLNAAVNEPDPSYNNEFIRPCRRVFDYVTIQQILLDIFQQGDKHKKIGVLKALYWTGWKVTILTIEANDITHEKRGREVFYWNAELGSFDHDYVEDPEYDEKEDKANEETYQLQLATLISAFYATDDIELKYHIRLRLPDKIENFPAPLKEQAEKYLAEKEKQKIPNNAMELEAAIGTKKKKGPL